jgi:hypothetical protein
MPYASFLDDGSTGYVLQAFAASTEHALPYYDHCCSHGFLLPTAAQLLLLLLPPLLLLLLLLLLRHHQVREIYESTIEAEAPNDLPEEDLRNLCVRYAQLERKLGEIDRARAIFVHGSHLADPRRAK